MQDKSDREIYFQKEYRKNSIRLKNYNYSQGIFFITIYTKNRESYFGAIKNGIMGLSQLGCIAWKCRKNIPIHFPNGTINEFIVMPDHVHGILELNTEYGETQNFASLEHVNHFGPQSKNLASVLRGFKIGVKKYATIHNIEFERQDRYREKIINNQQELQQIKKYIKNNPKKTRVKKKNLLLHKKIPK